MDDIVFGRREFLRLGAAGVAAAGLPGLAGCAHVSTNLPKLSLSPNPSSARNRVYSHSTNIPILPGQTEALRSILLEGKASEHALFARSTPGVHFARAQIYEAQYVNVPRDEFSLGIIYDLSVETGINFFVANGEKLDEVLQLCEAYVPGTAFDPVALHAYVLKYAADDKLFFTAYNTAESEVTASIEVMDNFLELVQGVESAPDSEVPYLFDQFLVRPREKARTYDASRPRYHHGYIPFSPQLTNTLSMVQPLKEGQVDPKKLVSCSDATLLKIERFLGQCFTYEQLFNFILVEGEFAVTTLHQHPLAALHTLHYGRIALVNGNMVFASVYDGDFTQYVRDFSSQVSDEIDLIWGLTKDYPQAGSRDVPGFIEWIRRGQVNVEDFYSAHGDITLIRLEKATALRKKLVTFTRSLPSNGKRLRSRLKDFLRENQALLT
jgi:hypothetical protein